MNEAPSCSRRSLRLDLSRSPAFAGMSGFWGKSVNIRTAAIAATLGLAPLGAQAQPLVSIIPVDAETSVNGVPVACTGIGQVRDDPRWLAYPVRVEFSDGRNAYLAGEVVQVRAKDGRPLLNAECDAPWLLLKLPPGRYTVEARIPGSSARPRSAQVTPPAHGQIRVVLQFPEIDPAPAQSGGPANPATPGPAPSPR